MHFDRHRREFQVTPAVEGCRKHFLLRDGNSFQPSRADHDEISNIASRLFTEKLALSERITAEDPGRIRLSSESGNSSPDSWAFREK